MPACMASPPSVGLRLRWSVGGLDRCVWTPLRLPRCGGVPTTHAVDWIVRWTSCSVGWCGFVVIVVWRHGLWLVPCSQFDGGCGLYVGSRVACCLTDTAAAFAVAVDPCGVMCVYVWRACVA